MHENNAWYQQSNEAHFAVASAVQRRVTHNVRKVRSTESDCINLDQQKVTALSDKESGHRHTVSLQYTNLDGHTACPYILHSLVNSDILTLRQMSSEPEIKTHQVYIISRNAK